MKKIAIVVMMAALVAGACFAGTKKEDKAKLKEVQKQFKAGTLPSQDQEEYIKYLEQKENDKTITKNEKKLLPQLKKDFEEKQAKAAAEKAAEPAPEAAPVDAQPAPEAAPAPEAPAQAPNN